MSEADWVDKYAEACRQRDAVKAQYDSLRAFNQQLIDGIYATKYIADLRALAGKMAEALELSQELPEINPSNYDHDEVCVLNSRVDEVCKVQKDALAAYSKAVGEGEGIK